MPTSTPSDEQARDKFLLALGDRICALDDPQTIMSLAAVMVERELGVSRVEFRVHCDTAEAQSLSAGPGDALGLDPPPWLPAMNAGEAFFSDDIEVDFRHDGGLGVGGVRRVRAAGTIPLMRGGHWVASIGLWHSEPRAWTDFEKQLLREVIERTWAAIERAREQAALRASEARYRTLFDSIDDGFCVMEAIEDVHGRLVDLVFREVNSAFERHTGLRDVLNRGVREALPRFEADWLATYSKVLATGEAIRAEHYVQDLDRRFDAFFSRVGGAGSRFVAVVFSDITDRRRAEARRTFLLKLADAIRPLADAAALEREASRILREQLRADCVCYWEVLGKDVVAAAEDAPSGAPSFVGARCRFADCGPIREEFMEGRLSWRDDIAGSSEFTPQEKAAYSATNVGAWAVAPLVKEGVLLAYLGAYFRGTHAWSPDELTLLQETAERTWAAVERARAEAALQESVERMRLAAVAARLFAWDVDLVSGKIRVSDEAPAILGFGPPRHLAEAMATYHPDDVERVNAEFAAAVGRGGDFEIEYRSASAEGVPVRWFRAVGTVVADASGKPARAIGVTHDVTTRKAAEEALQTSEQRARMLLAEATAAHEQAESANRAKDEFLATLSHELRTPLAAILLWAGALRSGGVPLNELARAIDAIAQSAESQSRLIEDLLDLSRLNAGKFALSCSAVDVGSVARAAVDMVNPMTTAKNLAFEVHIDSDLGLAVLDGTRLKQILANLLTNATKFTPEWGSITLRLSKRQGLLELEVADTGEGIAPEFMPHLFEKFRQADMGETRQFTGLGIGLALTKQLVELHGGTIEAESAGPGRGARFRALLPWIEPEAASADDARTAVTSAPSVAPLAGVHVLLVEDDLNTREGMRWMLEKAGANVTPVALAAQALAALDAETRPDIVVSDLGLPGVSGLELIERIGQRYRARGQRPPPSCAVSAHAREVDRRRAIDAGFDMYLAKPVTPERLIEAVTDLRDIVVFGAE